VFGYFPRIDLAVSHWFYDQDTGFFLNNHLLVQLSYRVFADIHWFVFLGLAWLIFASWYWNRNSEQQIRKKLIFMLIVLVLGPGLVVSTLKDTTGRPRPSEITEFGGQNTFKSPLVVSQDCDRNCSFVSGHASIAFYLICLAWVFRNPGWLWSGIILGTLVGTGRIAQGSHYLSDVVFSFWVVYGVCVLAAHWLLSNGTIKNGRNTQD
jgi:lipid A 4'-phosphatase